MDPNFRQEKKHNSHLLTFNGYSPPPKRSPRNKALLRAHQFLRESVRYGAGRLTSNKLSSHHLQVTMRPLAASKSPGAAGRPAPVTDEPRKKTGLTFQYTG